MTDITSNMSSDFCGAMTYYLNTYNTSFMNYYDDDLFTVSFNSENVSIGVYSESRTEVGNYSITLFGF